MLSVTVGTNELTGKKNEELEILALAISLLTRTEKVANTALSATKYFGVSVDVENMTATCPGIDAIRRLADADAIVRVIDEGNTPRPRSFTWGALVERLEACIAIAPALEYVREINDSIEGVITFEDKDEKPSKVKTSSTIDFSTLTLE